MRNADALPRAYLARHHRILDTAGALKHVVQGSFDFQHSVILDRDPGLPTVGETLEPVLPARIVSYAPEQVVVEARAEQPSVVVLTDTWLPGWQVTVDGRDAPLLRANGLYRAVAVAEGTHRVVFSYDAPGLRRGIAVSAAALSLLVSTPLALRRLAGSKGRPAEESQE